jgi:endonuclease/exonuclease/phosphatase family metal-dependent hydrolase
MRAKAPSPAPRLVLAPRLLVAALLLVALVAAAPSRASGEPALGATELRVASYNAWLLPIGSDDTAMRRDRMGPAIDALEPDLVCLQEVWTVDALEPVATALERRLPHVATGGGGLVILSRWPLRGPEFRAFPGSTAASLAEWFVRKGTLSAVVETPAGPLRVVNSHLTFTRSADRSDHMAQLDRLIEVAVEQPDVPVILCADLNLRAFEAGAPTEGFGRLLEAGFEDTAPPILDGPRRTRAGTRVGWPRAGRSARWDPDYVMFRQGESGVLSVVGAGQALDTEETALSDHNLLLVDFVLDAR